jgi:hypothetical protein
MAQQSLAQLQALVWTYLGTSSVDPLYTPTVVTGLLNTVANKYQTDLAEAAPSYNVTTTTLTASPASSNTYPLPANFGGWIEVRCTDYQGIPLGECKYEELNVPALAYSFAISGPDQAATLTTAPNVVAGLPLYFRYTPIAPDLVAAGDVPSWMPANFHDLLARDAAIDAFGIGSEDAPSPVFIQETNDRRAMWYLHIMRRGTSAVLTRIASPQ